jgi:broad specificity phosphatase PhoE
MENSQSLCTIYLVRHGETEWNVKEIIQGQVDSNLTQNGVNQAKAAGEMLKNVHFDLVFASDLSRAKRTAEYIVAERKLVVNTTKLLRERRFGKYEGRPGKEYREENKELFEKMEKMSELEKRRVKFDFGYENEEDLAARLLIFLREIAVTYVGKTVLAVSHGGAMRALLMHLGYATFDELRGRSVENTAYIKLDSDGIDFFVKETKGINKQQLVK